MNRIDSKTKIEEDECKCRRWNIDGEVRFFKWPYFTSCIFVYSSNSTFRLRARSLPTESERKNESFFFFFITISKLNKYTRLKSILLFSRLTSKQDAMAVVCIWTLVIWLNWFSSFFFSSFRKKSLNWALLKISHSVVLPLLFPKQPLRPSNVWNCSCKTKVKCLNKAHSADHTPVSSIVPYKRSEMKVFFHSGEAI